MPVAFVLVNADLGKEQGILKELRRIPGVKEAHFVYGVYDIVVKVEAESAEKLKEIVAISIRRLPDVRSARTMQF